MHLGTVPCLLFLVSTAVTHSEIPITIKSEQSCPVTIGSKFRALAYAQKHVTSNNLKTTNFSSSRLLSLENFPLRKLLMNALSRIINSRINIILILRIFIDAVCHRYRIAIYSSLTNYCSL